MNQNHFEHNSNYFGFDQPPQYSINHQPQGIQEDLNQQKMNDEFKIELRNELLKAMQSLRERILQREQVANVSTHTPEPSRRFNIIYDYDDDDNDDDDYEVSSIPLNDITSQIPSSIAITPVLPIKDSKNSLSMGGEHLSTIPKNECDLPSCNDFSPINVFEEKSVTFSNPLFDSNNDFTFSDDESLSDEDVPEDNVRIYSNPLFEFDDEYISSDVNPLFNKVLEDNESEDSYVSKLDEPDLLVTPLSKLNEDECFDPGGDVDEIKLLLHRDPSTPKISVAFILEGFTDEPPFEENDDLFDLESKENEWKKILYEASIDDLMTEDKVFDLEIPEKFFSPTYVSLPFEDRHYFSLTYVIRIFLPYFTYPMDFSLPLSSGSEDTIFDPGIPVFSLEPVVSHRSGTFMYFNVYLNILNESPINIFSSTLFIPNIMMIWG
ncbi:hypothetical protein Tco_1112419 [Tanacetum coccineum]|uniref:Uncharacterized protein n=1 Tax=Tanacetum coccineum TaxID=301880 RepID=A0ABQ5IPC3_9ASTR